MEAGVGYVPGWLDEKGVAHVREAIKHQLDHLTHERFELIATQARGGKLSSLQVEIEACFKALGDLELWEEELNVSVGRPQVSLSDIPRQYPGEVVGYDGVTVAQVRDAMSSLVLDDRTTADSIHMRMPAWAWEIVVRFLKGVDGRGG